MKSPTTATRERHDSRRSFVAIASDRRLRFQHTATTAARGTTWRPTSAQSLRLSSAEHTRKAVH